MLRSTCGQLGRAAALSLLMVFTATATATATLAADTGLPADGQGTARAAWLLQRESLQSLALTGEKDQPGEFAGGSAVTPAVEGEGGAGNALPVLASLVLPGAGEAMLGHKRGYLMMALDIFAWTQVSKYHSDGGSLRDEYYAYADAHYTDELLLAAYVPGGSSLDSYYRNGVGTDYFDFPTISTIDDLDNLPLYVTKEEDLREYYENLGKWDQFVFGWDDFVRPDDYVGYTPTGDAKTDLGQPFISANRETYRVMRDASNDAYKSRDRWLYVNIGLRVFSVLQTAYLGGLLGGNDDGDGTMSINGHEVQLIAQPTGLRRATVAATVSF